MIIGLIHYAQDNLVQVDIGPDTESWIIHKRNPFG